MSAGARRGIAAPIPYVDLAAQARGLKERLLAAAERVIDHGQFILGPEVGELERRLAEMVGCRHAVGVASGTDALVLGLRLAGVGPGHEVLTVSHSFVATASAIALVGAEPVFVDVDEATMLMDPDRLEEALTPRTRAVVPVHLNGWPCAMDAIGDFCRRHGLALVEDCAQALGARHRGQPVGSFGIGCFSLHPLKVLSALGDAGFVSLDDDEQAERLRQWRNLGLIDRDHCRWVSGNSRLDTLQAAFLLVKLDELPGWLAARRAHAEAYRRALAGRVTLPPEEGDDVAVHSCFAVRHPARDRLQAMLAERGVDAKAHYPLAIHQQEAFAARAVAGPPRPDLLVTERVVGEILSLPVTPELSAADRERVIEALVDCLDAIAPRGAAS